MKRIYYIIFLAALLFSCEKPISEFQSQNFIKLFGSGYESRGNDVIELTDGGFLITGYDKRNGTDMQVFVAKVDKSGNTIWSNTYGQAKNNDEGKVAKEVADGYLIAGTYKDGGISNASQHSFIRKIGFDGTEVFSYLIGLDNPDYNITVKDIIVEDKSIYIVGSSDEASVGSDEYYIASLNNLGQTLNDKSFSAFRNCSFNKIFIKGENLLLIGTNMTDRRISVGPYSKSTLGSDGTIETPGEDNEQAVDAAVVGENLFLLSTGGVSNTKLSKLNSNFADAVWTYNSPNSALKAKAFAYQTDGSVMVCSESVSEGNSLIHFIKINPDGSIFNNEEYFKTLGGNASKIIETRDKGLIMVGSTNSTYGTNIQLIKTDKDYFMLKNN